MTTVAGHVLPDALSRFRGTLPFADLSGPAHYPVNGPRLSGAHVLVTSYAPRQHLARHVMVAEIHLDEWRPASRRAPDDLGRADLR